MAKKAIIEKGTTGKVSWTKYNSTDFGVNDRLTGLLFDYSSPEISESATITIDGSETAFIKTISAGFVNADATLRTNALSLNGVDATTIYGGAVLSTASDLNKAATTTNLSVASKYTGAAVDVKGNVGLALKNVTATTVYGGGAGYGSTLEGDVNLAFSSTNRIGTVYGGGQKGAVVTGDVNILVSRTDAQEGGRISTIYGGGDNATVLGDVNVTVSGANAVSIGTISGSGKGTKSRVEGTRTLTIDDFSGKFTTTIKNFDVIQFTGASAVTLTQSQNSTIKSAEYEFVINREAFGQSADAMLTWNNSSVNTGNFYITIDVDDDYIANGFADKKIYYSSYLTAKSAANISVRAINEDGTFSDIDDSAYTLAFVADKDSKGDDKAKGGYVTLTYTGSKVSVTADTLEDVVLTSAADRVNVKGDIVDVSVDTGAGNDRVSVQSGTVMKGDIYLGKGSNVLNVQAGAQVTGSVVVDANSKNTINLNGAVSQIEGGDATTENIVNINNDEAVGFYRNGVFFQQDLTFANDSADTVVVSTASNYTGNINFGKGKDTLVLNTTATGTITSEDGNDIIVANKSGVNIDTTALRLTGTDNALVIANGVRADVTGVAVGDFKNLESDTFTKGIYLGQNAILGTGDDIAVSSFNGDFNLAGTMTVLAADQLDATADKELIARIGNYYTAGKGVNGTIQANGNNIVLKDGAVVNGTVINGGIAAQGNAGGDLAFEGAAINVTAEGAKMTVKSIEGLDVSADTTLGTKDYLEADLGQITLANDAQVIATADDLTVAGPITGATLFETKNVAFTGAVKDTAKVALADQNAYFAATSNVNGAEFAFAGTNALEIKGNIAFDNKKLTLAEGAKVTANVLEDGVLAVRGIVNGEASKIAAADVTLENNAEFVVGNVTETADWNRQFTDADVNSAVINFRDGAQIVKGINVTAATDLTIGNGSYVKNDNADDAITIGGTVEKLTIGESEVYGRINSTGTTDIVLNKTTLKGVDGAAAADLAGGTLVATNADISGDVNGGRLVQLDASTVTGKVTGTVEALASNIGEVAGGKTTVLGANAEGVAVNGITQIGKYTEGELIVDGSVAEIGEISQNVAKTSTTQLRVMNDGQVRGDKIAMNTDTGATLEVIDAEVAAVEQKSDAAVVKFNYTKDGQVVFADTAKTGDIVQTAVEVPVTADYHATTATVNAQIVYNRTAIGGTFLADEVEAVTAAPSTVTGDITQKANSAHDGSNTFVGGVTVNADGTYGYVPGDANPTKHKEVKVTLDSVNASYGDVNQIGAFNDVNANIRYTASGESDVAVNGVSTMTIGTINQYSEYQYAANLPEPSVNTVNVNLAIAGLNQGVLTLKDDVSANVGAVKQTAFLSDNSVTFTTARYDELEAMIAADTVVPGVGYGRIDDEGKKVSIQVNGTLDETTGKKTAIEMNAYGANNTLTMYGNVTVDGDIKVGGMLKFDKDGNEYTEGASFADRTAQTNTVTADAATVTVNGDLSMIGINNNLTINNSGDGEVTFANNVYVAGNNNTLTVGTGVTTENIHFYELKDYDKFGQEGYEIGLPTYSNGLTINGTVGDIIITQEMSNDTINVYGGTVKGNVDTKNSDYHGGDTVRVGDGITELNSVITGNVTMGIAAAPEGKNSLKMQGTVTGAGTAEEVVYKAEIDGNVAQYADDDNKIELVDNSEIKGTVTQVGNATNEVKIGTANEIVGKTTQNVTAVTSEITVNGKKLSVYGGDAENQFGTTYGNTSTTKVGDVEQTSVSARGWGGGTASSNYVAIAGSMEVVNPDETIFGESDKTASYKFYAKAGAISQNGSANRVEVQHLEAVKSISQTATALDYATVVEFGKFVNTNRIVSTGNATVGTVDQTLTNVAYTQYTKDVAATEFIGDGTEKYTKANNELTATGLVTDSFAKEKGTAPLSTKDQFHNGEYVSTIGNVTQTLTGAGDPEGSQAMNKITLDDIKAGALTQTATGNAVNAIYYTGSTASIAQYRYGDETKTEDPTLAYAADAITSKIESITQVSNAALFKSDDAKTTYATGENTVTLNNVEVGAISATSGEVAYNTEKVLEGDKLVDKKTKDVVANSKVFLDGVKASAGITTGAGDDTITLKGKTSVIGTIDGGTFTKAEDATGDKYVGRTADSDELVIKGNEIDLSQAAITNVEKITVAGATDPLKISSITGGTVEVTGATTLKVTTLDVTTIAGGNNVRTLASVDDKTAINYTADSLGKGESYINKIDGASAATTDKLVIDGGCLYGVAVEDVENIEFKAGATADANCSWSHGTFATDEKVAFTIADLAKSKAEYEEKGESAKAKSFLIGTVTSIDNSKITVNGLGWNGNVKVWTSDTTKTKLAAGDFYYEAKDNNTFVANVYTEA